MKPCALGLTIMARSHGSLNVSPGLTWPGACATIEVTLFAMHRDAGGINRCSVHSKQLAAGRRSIGPGIESVDQFLNKVRREYRIRIQKQHILRCRSPRKFIVRFAESSIDGRPDDGIRRKRFDGLQRVVGRGVIENMDSKIAEGLFAQALQTCANVWSTVECDDIDRNLRRHHPLSAPSSARPYAAA